MGLKMDVVSEDANMLTSRRAAPAFLRGTNPKGLCTQKRKTLALK